MTATKSKKPKIDPLPHKIGFIQGSERIMKVEGDVVLLVDRRYGSTLDNPYFKGKHACFGTVEEAVATGVRVRWDNGRHNGYRHSALAFPKSSKFGLDPNRAFLRRKKPPKFDRWVPTFKKHR